MLVPNTLIIHCEPSHTTRLASYFSTEFSSELSEFEVLDTKQGLIKCSMKLTDMRDICDFVNDELYHNATTNRYLHRFFLCNEIGTNFHNITAALSSPNQDDSTWVIRIQCFPKLEYKVGNYLMEHCYKKPSFHNFELNPKTFTHILSVVQYNGKYYFGIVTKDMFYVKADDNFNIESPCRAHYKIKEVFDRCNHLHFDIPETGKAIDLGAAPGGWTKFLSERLPKGQVIAIDPAELTIEMTPNIVHLKIRAEDSVEYLSKNGPYDCIVCDIATLNHEDLVQMFAHIIPYLKSGAPLIWTIKLRRRSEESKRLMVHIEDAVVAFKKEFEDKFDPIEIIWLLSNKAERTVVAIKK